MNEIYIECMPLSVTRQVFSSYIFFSEPPREDNLNISGLG